MACVLVAWRQAAYMVQQFKSYLRPLRRRWGFSQKELAFLIGSNDNSGISRLEGLKTIPSVKVVFACALIFNTAPIKLFPGLFSEIEASVFARANELYDDLQGSPSETTRIKLDFLEELLARLERRRNPAT